MWETLLGWVMKLWFPLVPPVKCFFMSQGKALHLLCKHYLSSCDVLGSKHLLYINVEVLNNGREQRCFRSYKIFIWRYAILVILKFTGYSSFLQLSLVHSLTSSFCQLLETIIITAPRVDRLAEENQCGKDIAFGFPSQHSEKLCHASPSIRQVQGTWPSPTAWEHIPAWSDTR